MEIVKHFINSVYTRSACLYTSQVTDNSLVIFHIDPNPDKLLMNECFNISQTSQIVIMIDYNGNLLIVLKKYKYKKSNPYIKLLVMEFDSQQLTDDKLALMEQIIGVYRNAYLSNPQFISNVSEMELKHHLEIFRFIKKYPSISKEERDSIQKFYVITFNILVFLVWACVSIYKYFFP